MAWISRKDYNLLLLPGFTVPPAWFPNVPVPHHHHEETILLDPAQISGPVHLSPNSKTILANLQQPPSWSFLHAIESGIASAVEAINNRPHDAVQAVHLGRPILASKFLDMPGQLWDPEVGELLRAARSSAPPDHSIHSVVYNAGGFLDCLSPFSRHIVCGAAVMTLALKERIEILSHHKGETNFDHKFLRVGVWKFNEEDQQNSVARFKGTTQIYKESGLKKVKFDSKLMEHIEVKGCYENATVLMGGWMTRLLIPGNQQFRNLLCASELTFYLDHNLDYHGIINMYEIFCKLAGCIELGVGVRQAGLAFGTALHNDMKRKQEDVTGKTRKANIRMNHLTRFEFISAMICDIGVFEVLAYEEFGNDEVNDGALCGFLQDFTDVGEDSACGELGFSLGAWGPNLQTSTVLKWITDLARLQNHGLIHRPERPIVIANYLITLWNCLDDRHHTLPRALSYLRHAKLGFIDGYTQIYDLFDEKMNYIGEYTRNGALEEMDGENIIKECSIGWDQARNLNYRNLAVQIINTINKMRECQRVLESALLIVRWFIYVPRMIREDIENVQFAQDMAKLCQQVEDDLRSAFLVISCWMKFDDREFGFFRSIVWHFWCRESLAEAAALYSLDQSQHDKFHNLDTLVDSKTRF